MSLSDFQNKLGTPVSPRQFRRYVSAEVIPSAWIKKNAQGHFVITPPPTEKVWFELREKIESWREKRFQRGWEKREPARVGNSPSDVSDQEFVEMMRLIDFNVFTREGIALPPSVTKEEWALIHKVAMMVKHAKQAAGNPNWQAVVLNLESKLIEQKLAPFRAKAEELRERMKAKTKPL